MLETPHSWGSLAFSSVSTFKKRTWPRSSPATLPIVGANLRQGPHQGAQNSINTGTFERNTRLFELTVAKIDHKDRFPFFNWPLTLASIGAVRIRVTGICGLTVRGENKTSDPSAKNRVAREAHRGIGEVAIDVPALIDHRR